MEDYVLLFASSSSTTAWTALAILVPLVIFVGRRLWTSSRDDDRDIPRAPGAIPVIGHALLYKHDPPGFLNKACEQVGPIFRINLAGKHMILIGRDCAALRQVATSTESICSARDAVAAIGFEETLGYRNVHVGTDIHKQILKGVLFEPTKYKAEIPKLYQAVERAFGTELSLFQDDGDVINVPDFLQLVRRVIMRATVERLLGLTFLEHGGPQFVTDFSEFQDALEDATAKAAVLPRWIALPACLWPVKKRRLMLQTKIVAILKRVFQDKESVLGLWLETVKEDQSVEEIAELIVGLLFAAHKNPAIGAAQAFLFLKERATPEDRTQCQAETKRMAESPTANTLESCHRLKRVCLETLRLTAHSIGAVRTARKDFLLDQTKYVVKMGETIGLSHIAQSLDESAWKNATQFDTTLHEDALYQDPYKFTTFSHGIHKCPGQLLATSNMIITLAVLMAKYDVTVSINLPPVSFERATLAQREGPVPVSMELKTAITTFGRAPAVATMTRS
jgi:sterol 14-demethylase